MSPQRVELVISGVVQGVGFRYHTYQKAQQLRLTGWVKNMPDGRVTVVAEGERGELEILIAELKTGPRFGVVHNVDLRWAEATGQYTAFEVQF